jgi:hypothetical protein
MPKHTVPAAGGAMPVRGRHIPSDPVAELGAEMAVVQKAMAVADELINSSQEHSKEGVDAKLLHEALYNRLYALVDNAMSQPARSFAGAMVQVALINHFMNEMQHCPEYSETTAEEVDQRCHFAIRSIIDVLAKAAGVDPKGLSVDFWAGSKARLPGRFDAALAAARNGDH